MHRKIDITKLELFERRLPEKFDGCRILHISDLHNCHYAKGQQHLIKLSRQQNPDYIFITGDMIDQYHGGIEQACRYIQGLVNIAPIFFVTGNHEWEALNKERGTFFNFLEQSKVVVLHDKLVKLTREDSSLQLIGIDDPYIFCNKIGKVDDRAFARDFLMRLCVLKRQMENNMFTILLSHRPEFIHYYAKSGFNLVFSGHAHGGQFRLPIFGNILAPHQGFFPKYAEGIILEGNTSMVISRGLGNSLFPVRVGNHPELVVVTLRMQRKKE